MKKIYLTVAILFLLGGHSSAENEGGGHQDEARQSIPHAERQLKEKDEVQLIVFGEDSLSVTSRIDSSGSINFPLVGNVTVSGRTAGEVAAEVERRLEADYIRDAHVTLTVLEEFREKEKPRIVRASPVATAVPLEPAGSVSILGEVRQPGTVRFDGDEIDLLTVLAQTGGFTPLANPKKVTVRRQGRGGQAEVFTVNAIDLQNGGERFLLRPGDSISVAKRLF